MLVAPLSRSAGFRCVSAFRPVNDRPGRVDQQMKSDMMQDLIGQEGRGRLGTGKPQVCALQNRRPLCWSSTGSVAVDVLCDGASMRRTITRDGPQIRAISDQCADAAGLNLELGGQVAAGGRADLSRRPDPHRPGTIPRAASQPLSAACSALHVWCAFGLLITLVAVPLFSTVLPPLFDYPNHLARLYLLMEGGNTFYAVRWELLPNLAQDLIVPPLARLMPLDLASKLFLVMVFGLIAGGAIWLNRVATGAWRFWPLLAFLLLYNRIFLWGFVNYLFGIGVALGGTALWLALEPRGLWCRVLASSVVALLCYFSHIAALGFYALVILGVEVRPAITELRARQWAVLGRRILAVGTQFVCPAALFLSYWQWTAFGGVSYADFWRKADLVFSVFDNYDRILDVVCFALFLGLLGWLGWTRRLALMPRLRWAIWIVFVSYLVMPAQMYGGSNVDHRLPTAWFVLVIASSAPRFPTRRFAMAIGLVAGSMLVIRLVVIEQVWRQADEVYSADLIGIDALPRGVKLAVAIPPDAIQLVSVPEVHLPALAASRREAFVPTLFAYPGQQPIALRASHAALADTASPQLFWSVLTGGDIEGIPQLLPVLQEYDYVVLTGRPVDVPSPRCLVKFYQQPSFQIFAVLHDPGCASTDR